MIAKNIDAAITKRQNAMENMLTPGIKRMKIAAVPKNVPAIAPSKRADLRVLSGTLFCLLLHASVYGSVELSRLRMLKNLGIDLFVDLE